jgi:transcriptional antiterminator NusG
MSEENKDTTKKLELRTEEIQAKELHNNSRTIEETKETSEEQAIQQTKTNDNPNARWYVVHTYSGHENKVAATLKQRAVSMGLEHKILEILVPTQEKIEVKDGKKVTVHDKIFPGYILVRMELSDESWHAVRSTAGVTSFVGTSTRPTPLPDEEVQTILRFTQMEAPKYKATFTLGEAIKIIDGPFSDFLGTVDEIDEEKGRLKALISIFGRETPVELDFLQVSKI